ncbi:MAG: acyl-protein synthetase [Candidatus Methylomirabilis sp.]|nr:acyl-protein synthetase [Deltaproteobacteria bacterium]
MNAAGLDARIDALIAGAQFALPQAEKDRRLVETLAPLCERVAAGCPPYRRFLDRLGPSPSAWRAPEDVPPLPVSMFKRYALRAVPTEEVVRELHSSSTTGDSPSRILIDKATAFRQARALVAVLKDFLGGKRRPYLVLDAPESAGAGETLVARGAAIRGVGNFASSTTYGMRALPGGDLAADWDAIEGFFRAHGAGPALVFGFTFIVWSRFVREAEARGLRFPAAQATLLHSGGWKKLAAEAVSKDEFSRRTAAVLGAPAAAVVDFYGMVEQVGTVFVDCAAGAKHAPAFADVLLRRPHTLRPATPGESGVIEVLSVLPTSYPGQAILTEDQGELLGVDDCPCGRKGRYFRFTSRVERTAVRGCGDAFAQAREVV